MTSSITISLPASRPIRVAVADARVTPSRAHLDQVQGDHPLPALARQRAGMHGAAAGCRTPCRAFWRKMQRVRPIASLILVLQRLALHTLPVDCHLGAGLHFEHEDFLLPAQEGVLRLERWVAGEGDVGRR